MTERVICSEDNGPKGSFRLIAEGAVDRNLLAALEGYIERQRDRLTATHVVRPIGPWRLWMQK